MVNAPLFSINYAGMPRRAHANACAKMDPLFVYFEYFVVKNRINLQASTGSAHFTTQACPAGHKANACATIDPLFVYFEYLVVRNRINLQASTGSAHYTTQACPAGHRRMPALQWISFLCIFEYFVVNKKLPRRKRSKKSLFPYQSARTRASRIRLSSAPAPPSTNKAE